MNRRERNVIRLGLLLGTLAGVMTGCAHGPTPVVETEAVGQLVAGPSTWSAPVHASTAPPTVEIAAGDDDVADAVTTTVRADVSVEAADAAPDPVAKEAHGF